MLVTSSKKLMPEEGHGWLVNGGEYNLVFLFIDLGHIVQLALLVFHLRSRETISCLLVLFHAQRDGTVELEFDADPLSARQRGFLRPF